MAASNKIHVWADSRPVTAALLSTAAEIFDSSVELAPDGSRAYAVVEGTTAGTLRLQTFDIAALIGSVSPAHSVEGVGRSRAPWAARAGPGPHDVRAVTAWGVSAPLAIVTQPVRHQVADYDGNGTIDIAVFRPSTGTWFVHGGPAVAFGTNGDIPVPGDYDDGNGAAEIVVFRPSSGTWFHVEGPTFAWGTDGDIPVPGDYNGDGTTETGVFRPSSGLWFPEGAVITAWGTNGDIPGR